MNPDDLKAFEKLLACGVPFKVESPTDEGDDWFVKLGSAETVAAMGVTLPDAVYAALDKLYSSKDAAAVNEPDAVRAFIETHGLRLLSPRNQLPPCFAWGADARELKEAEFISLCASEGVDCFEVVNRLRN